MEVVEVVKDTHNDGSLGSMCVLHHYVTPASQG